MITISKADNSVGEIRFSSLEEKKTFFEWIKFISPKELSPMPLAFWMENPSLYAPTMRLHIWTSLVEEFNVLFYNT